MVENFHKEEKLISNLSDENSHYIKNYTSVSSLFGISFQNNKSELRLCASTIEVSKLNQIEIIEQDKDNDKLIKVSSIESDFPCSKILWSPDQENNTLLAATSDILRLYSFDSSTRKVILENCLSKKNQGFSGPLTSLDWNKANSSIIGVCSIDTTCTIWDLVKNDARAMLIAHDKEVYDIAFGGDEYLFLTTGADGSIRQFDTRNLESCSILFESQDNNPITRISWNFSNLNFISAITLEKNLIYIIDQRNTNTPYAILSYHSNVVNNAIWAPNSSSVLCSVSDDKSTLIWDIQINSSKSDDPCMSYSAEYEVENVGWSESHEEWIGITCANSLQLLKIK